MIAPPPNVHAVPLTSVVSITYDEPVSVATVSTGTFAVHAQVLGVNGSTISLTPTQVFKPGELTVASATTGT